MIDDARVPDWKRLAFENWPDLVEPDDVYSDGDSIYVILYELLDRVREAHLKNDTLEIARIYRYVEWAFRHEDKTIWNAAGVGFYEHLVDDPITTAAIPSSLSPDIYSAVRGLFEYRMEPNAFADLDAAFRHAHWRHLPKQSESPG